MPKRSEPQDFWKYVDRTNLTGCWLWTRSMSEQGYGRVRYQGQEWKASRLAWHLTYGDPGDLSVLHHCDNPPCCNPNHLFKGTSKDNMQDMVNKERHPRNKTGYLPSGDAHHSRQHPERMARGEKNGSASLTERQVRAILLKHQEGATWRSLASEFHTSKGNIGFIVQRKTWKHVNMEELDNDNI